jgi:hypothetical protein
MEAGCVQKGEKIDVVFGVLVKGNGEKRTLFLVE